MGGISPAAMLLIAAIFGAYLLVHEAIHGVQVAAHKVMSAVHHIIR